MSIALGNDSAAAEDDRMNVALGSQPAKKPSWILTLFWWIVILSAAVALAYGLIMMGERR